MLCPTGPARLPPSSCTAAPAERGWPTVKWVNWEQAGGHNKCLSALCKAVGMSITGTARVKAV